MDGTIASTLKLIYESFNYVANKYIHKTFVPKEIVKFFGPPEEGAIVKMLNDGQSISLAMDDYLQFYRSNHRAMAKTCDGIEEILGYLKQKERLITLFTGKGTSTTKITLEELGLTKYFDYVITGNDVTKFKPSGEGILKILERFALKPSEAVMIGDTTSDVYAARDAGVAVASVLWESYSVDSVVTLKPDFVFNTVDDFKQWIVGME
jgi:HAD superfamily hydrolase (TIGR01509 family)